MSIQIDQLKPFITWLHLHPQWGGFFAFLISFVESLAVVGLIVPGTVIMTAFGILVGSNVLPIIPTMLWATAGAFSGDVVSYWLGHHYHGHIREMWPFRRVPGWLNRGENFFALHGGKGVFIGRFIGPIRPILPLIAGMMNMKPAKFLIVDFISAIFWSPFYMLPGILIGAASLALAPEATSRLIISLIIVLLVFWLLFWLLRRLFIAFIHLFNYMISHLWHWMRKHTLFKPLCSFLQIQDNPDDHTQLALVIFFLLSLTLFLILTIQVIAILPVAQLNLACLNFFRSIYTPRLEQIAVIITLLFDPKVLIIMWMCVSLYFVWRKNWNTLIHWLMLGFFSIGFAGFIKRILHIPRPLGIEYVPLTGSYPSEHITLTMAFFGFLAVLWSLSRSYMARWLAYSNVIIIILTVILSRLYLGAHWFTDSIGGCLLATTLIFGVTLSYRRSSNIKISVYELIAVVLLSQAVAGSFVIFTNYTRALNDYLPKWPTYELSVESWWQDGLKDHPLFRNDRFGTPVQTMNIEWLGDISTIKQDLEQQGWQARFLSPWLRTLSYFGTKDRSKMLPLLPVVYQGKKPILIMAKLVGEPQRLLILRLWSSYAVVTDSDDKIWIGTLNYQHDSKNPLLFELKTYPPLLNITPVTTSFTQYLHNFQWKKLNYTDLPRLNNTLDIDWDGYVLLVKEKDDAN